MTARTCQTCKHYEPSAVWRRGWCRNPRLYAPQQSHLVDQDALDCSRGLGSAWEAADGDTGMPRARPERIGWQPLRLFGPQPQTQFAGASGAMMASSNVGGGSGAGGTGGSFSGPPRPDRAGPPAGQERTVSYQPEERYWTDYLRIALPVAGLLLLLGVAWYWAGQVIGDGDEEGPAATTDLAEVTITASPTTVAPSATAATIAPTPGDAPAPTATTPAQAPAPTRPAAPQEEPAEEPAGAGEPTSQPASDPRTFDQQYAIGTTVVSIEDGVRLRQEASTESAALETLSAGTELEVTGEFVDGGPNQRDWWPVTNPASGQSGFVREDFLEEQ